MGQQYCPSSSVHMLSFFFFGFADRVMTPCDVPIRMDSVLCSPYKSWQHSSVANFTTAVYMQAQVLLAVISFCLL
jgi:hypothetical protein